MGMRRLIPQASLLAAVAAVALVLGGCGQQTAAPEAGAPDFSFTALDGQTVSLAALRGKPVLLNFWASWCHFCAEEAPHLEALHREHQSAGLQVLGVGTDSQDALRQKAADLNLTYPVGSNPEAAKAYGVGGVPHTFIISREGKIVASLIGARSKAELETEVRKVL
jgi:cytochrome c biogenesis protein CcmG/thiol:disulfide interchange protein DsbE